MPNNFYDVLFTANGGIIDMFYFGGPTFSAVIKQYQNIIGKPSLPPLYANGFYSKSDAYMENDAIVTAIGQY